MVVMRLPHQDKTSLKSRQQYQQSSNGSGCRREKLGIPKSQSLNAAVPPNDGDCHPSHGSPHSNTRGSRTIDVARASFRRPAPRDWIIDRPTNTTDTKTDIVLRKTTNYHHASIAATRSSSSTSCHTASTTKSSDSNTRHHVATTPATARNSNRRSNDQMLSETDSDVLVPRSRTAYICGCPSRLVEYESQPKYRPTSSFARGMVQRIPKQIRIQPNPTLAEIPNQVFIPPEPDDHSTSDVSLDELYGLFKDQADDRTLTLHPSFDNDDTHRDHDDVKDFHFLYQSFLRLEAKEFGTQNPHDHQNSDRDTRRPEPAEEVDDSFTAGLLDVCWGLCMDLKLLCTRSWKDDFKCAMDTATFTFLQDPGEQENNSYMKHHQRKCDVVDETSFFLNQTNRGRARPKNSSFKSHNRWEWV
jgi:hypothetical protein